MIERMSNEKEQIMMGLQKIFIGCEVMIFKKLKLGDAVISE
jgi:hypothetical protein